MTFNPMMRVCVETLKHKFPEGFSVCELGSQTNTSGKESVPDYYRTLGAGKYDALDFDGKGTVKWDLNEVYEGEKYDLVTNNGTGEHIFNQAAVFETVHNLSKKYILHVLPFFCWVNHGFYNFHPTLFRDLARANGYKVLWMRLGERNGHSVPLPETGFNPITPKKPNGDLWNALKDVVSHCKHQPNVMLCVAFKKTNDDPFKFPVQMEYDAPD